MNTLLMQRKSIDRRIQRVLGVGLFIVCAASYLAVYRPASSARAQIINDMSNAQSQLNEDQQRASSLDSVRDEVGKLERQLKRFKPLSGVKELADFHEQLSGLGDATGIRKYTLNQRPSVSLATCREWPTDVTFEASFDDAAKFLSRLESIDRLTRVRRLKIDTIDSRQGTVRVSLSLSLFSTEE